MAKTVENAWVQRRPKWYVRQVGGENIQTLVERHQSEYEEYYVGLGSHVWERIVTRRRDGQLGEWIRDYEYKKLLP